MITAKNGILLVKEIKNKHRNDQKQKQTSELVKNFGSRGLVLIDLLRILGIESVNCGFSLPDDNAHSPNEKLHLPTWERGIETLINFYHNLAK